MMHTEKRRHFSLQLSLGAKFRHKTQYARKPSALGDMCGTANNYCAALGIEDALSYVPYTEYCRREREHSYGFFVIRLERCCYCCCCCFLVIDKKMRMCFRSGLFYKNLHALKGILKSGKLHHLLLYGPTHLATASASSARFWPLWVDFGPVRAAHFPIKYIKKHTHAQHRKKQPVV